MQLEVIAAEHSQQHSQGCSGGRAMSPKARTSAVPDRSEIGPYHGGGSAKQRRSYHPLANLRRAPEVGRCLRQRRVCSAGPLGDRSLPRRLFGEGTRVLLQAGQSPASSGGRAMSPTAPCPQRRTARRSVPTSEAVRGRNAGLATGWPISGELLGRPAA